MVTWDDGAGKMMPFGHNRTYAKEEADGEGSGGCPFMAVASFGVMLGCLVV